MEQTGIRGAESWQFFAFVFAAVITFAFTLINELLHLGWRIILKLVAFAFIGYLTLLTRGYKIASWTYSISPRGWRTDDRRDQRNTKASSPGASSRARWRKIRSGSARRETVSIASGQSLLHPSTRGRGRCG
jgi:hypothetical protein